MQANTLRFLASVAAALRAASVTDVEGVEFLETIALHHAKPMRKKLLRTCKCVYMLITVKEAAHAELLP